MTWQDQHGITHEVSTFTDSGGDVRVRASRDIDGPFANLGERAWMRCRVRAPPRSRESLGIVDCMTCLVRKTR